MKLTSQGLGRQGVFPKLLHNNHALPTFFWLSMPSAKTLASTDGPDKQPSSAIILCLAPVPRPENQDSTLGCVRRDGVGVAVRMGTVSCCAATVSRELPAPLPPPPSPLIVSVMEVTSAATQYAVDLGVNDGEGRARQSFEQLCTAHAVRRVEVGPEFVPRLPGFV